MRSIEAGIDKIRLALGIFLDASRSFGSNKVCGVAFLVARLPIVVPVKLFLSRMVEVIKGTVQGSMEMRKTTIERVVSSQ